MPSDDPLKTSVHGKTTSPGGVCEFVTPGSLPPCTLVIFGASGDLTARKLIPAFYSMHRNNTLPESFVIVGASRTEMSHDQFRDKLKKAVSEDTGVDASDWESFAAKLFYHNVTYDSVDSCSDLGNFLRELDQEKGTGGNRVFYLAVPPNLYRVIAEKIGKAGLSQENTNGNGWVRIVVEKPFGRDLKTATELDDTLHSSFNENQIFRIDHYQ
jgi:glucose-6-phosphate 1-dehydrogenase